MFCMRESLIFPLATERIDITLSSMLSKADVVGNVCKGSAIIFLLEDY